MTPEQQRKLQKLQELSEKGEVAILKYLFEIEEKIEKAIPELSEVILRMKGDKGDSPTEKELLALIKPLIPPQPEDGHTPTKSELLDLIKPLIPQVKDGHTPTKEELINIIKPLIPQINESDIVKRAVAEVEKNITLPSVDELVDKVEKDLPKLSEGIRDGLELLQDEERLDSSAIKNLPDYQAYFKDIDKRLNIIATNKPLSEMLDVNVQGLQTNQALKWNGREWIPYTPVDVAAQWGQITGNLTDQTDLTDYISDQLATQDTLQEVTDNGATTTNNITIDNGGLTNNVLNINGSTHSYIRSSATDLLQLGHGGSPRMTIDGSGNVGIGTNSPSERLDVVGNLELNGDFYVKKGGNTGLLRIAGGSNNILQYGASGSGFLRASFGIGGASTALGSNISTYSDGKTEIQGVGGEILMTVLDSGNVGIRTSTPAAGLEIRPNTSGGPGFVDIGKSVHIKSLTPSISLEDVSAGTDNYAIYLNQDDLTIGRYTSETSMESDLVLSGGNVGMGTDSPDEKLEVVGNIKLDDSFYTDQSSIRFYTSGNEFAFRVLDSFNGWDDTTASAFFQLSKNADRNGFFTAENGVTLNRFGVSSHGTTLWDSSYSNMPAPTGLLHLETNSASRDILNIVGSPSQTGDYINITSNGGSEGDVFTITSDGDVGIGTDSPTATLHSKGDKLRLEEDSATRQLDIHPAVSGDNHRFTSTNTDAGFTFENSNGDLLNLGEDDAVFEQPVSSTAMQTYDSFTTPKYVMSKGEQLIANSWLLMDNTYNWEVVLGTDAELYSDDSKGYKYSVKTSGQTRMQSTELIPVNAEKTYQGKINVRLLSEGATQEPSYVGCECFDKDGNSIEVDRFYLYDTGTKTTLAQDLEDGDTVVHLTSVANWYTGTSSVTNWFAVYLDPYYRDNYEDYYLADYDKTARYDGENVDAGNNTITLEAAWSGGTVPAGTPVANTQVGARYNYFVRSGFYPTDTEWTTLSDQLQPRELYDYSNSNNLIRPGTSFVRMIIFSHWGAGLYNSDYEMLWDGFEFKEDETEILRPSVSSNFLEFTLTSGGIKHLNPRLAFQENGFDWYSDSDTSTDYDIDVSLKRYITETLKIDGRLFIERQDQQLQLRHDSSNYLSVDIDSNGDASLGLTGTNPEFTFADPVNMSDGLDITGDMTASGTTTVNALALTEKSSDPPDPAEGESIIWQSDGTGSGDDGDIMVKITAGATTKTATLVDFSTI